MKVKKELRFDKLFSRRCVFSIAAMAFALLILGPLLISADQTPIRTAGLVAHYKMESIDAGLMDELDLHNGTLDASVSVVTGIHGNALAFDGVNSWGRVEGMNLTDNMALSCWVKFDEIGRWDPIAIVSRSAVDTGLGLSVGYLYPDKVFPTQSIAYNNGGYYIHDRYDTGFSPVTGTWYHFVVQKNSAGDVELWVNGNLQGEFAASSTYASSLAGANGLNLAKNGYGEAFKGALDTIRIYDLTEAGALSGQEIQDLYQEEDYSIPQVSISINPTLIQYGESTTITWNSVYAQSVMIDNGVGTVGAFGSLSISPTASTIYTITAQGLRGTATDTANIVVANNQAADTDSDGLSDTDEINIFGTDPSSADTDGDKMPDGWEVINNLNPLVDDALEDKDGDGYNNYVEYKVGANPNNAGETISVTTQYEYHPSGGVRSAVCVIK